VSNKFNVGGAVFKVDTFDLSELRNMVSRCFWVILENVVVLLQVSVLVVRLSLQSSTVSSAGTLISDVCSADDVVGWMDG
jgi:hypothetical protein